MKYVLILVAVVLLVRIDLVMHGVETLVKKVKDRPATPVIPQNLPQPDDLIPIKEDKAISRSPRTEFFTLIDEFQLNPEKDVRERIADVLRRNPTLLGPKLDPKFEGEVFKFADLIYNKEPQLPWLLLDLLALLQGENQEAVKKVFTIMLDNDLEGFLKAYVGSKDSNCMIAGLIGHRIPPEEVLNELIDREERIAAFLTKEKVDPAIMTLAKSCHLVVKLQISKLAPPPPPEAPAPAPEDDEEEAP